MPLRGDYAASALEHGRESGAEMRSLSVERNVDPGNQPVKRGVECVLF